MESENADGNVIIPTLEDGEEIGKDLSSTANEKRSPMYS